MARTRTRTRQNPKRSLFRVVARYGTAILVAVLALYEVTKSPSLRRWITKAFLGTVSSQDVIEAPQVRQLTSAVTLKYRVALGVVSLGLIASLLYNLYQGSLLSTVVKHGPPVAVRGAQSLVENIQMFLTEATADERKSLTKTLRQVMKVDQEIHQKVLQVVEDNRQAQEAAQARLRQLQITIQRLGEQSDQRERGFGVQLTEEQRRVEEIERSLRSARNGIQALKATNTSLAATNLEIKQTNEQLQKQQTFYNQLKRRLRSSDLKRRSRERKSHELAAELERAQANAAVATADSRAQVEQTFQALQTAQEAKRRAETQFKARFSVLEQQLREAEAKIRTGASSRQRSSARKVEELEAIRRKLEKATQQSQVLRQKVKELQERVRQKDADAKAASDKLRAFGEQKGTLEAEIEKLTASQTAFTESKQNEISTLRRKLDAEKTLLSSTNTAVETLGRRKRKLEEQLARLNKQLGQRRDNEANLQAAETELRKAKEQLRVQQEQKQNDEARLSDLRRQLTEVQRIGKAEVQRLTTEYSKLRREHETALKRQQDELKRAYADETKRVRHDLQIKINNGKQQLQALENQGVDERRKNELLRQALSEYKQLKRQWNDNYLRKALEAKVNAEKVTRQAAEIASQKKSLEQTLAELERLRAEQKGVLEAKDRALADQARLIADNAVAGAQLYERQQRRRLQQALQSKGEEKDQVERELNAKLTRVQEDSLRRLQAKDQQYRKQVERLQSKVARLERPVAEEKRDLERLRAFERRAQFVIPELTSTAQLASYKCNFVFAGKALLQLEQQSQNKFAGSLFVVDNARTRIDRQLTQSYIVGLRAAYRATPPLSNFDVLTVGNRSILFPPFLRSAGARTFTDWTRLFRLCRLLEPVTQEIKTHAGFKVSSLPRFLLDRLEAALEAKQQQLDIGGYKVNTQLSYYATPDPTSDTTLGTEYEFFLDNGPTPVRKTLETEREIKGSVNRESLERAVRDTNSIGQRGRNERTLFLSGLLDDITRTYKSGTRREGLVDFAGPLSVNITFTAPTPRKRLPTLP